MKLELKIRKLGNSWGVILAKTVITDMNWKEGQVITLYTEKEKEEHVVDSPVITPKARHEEPFDTRFCPKHKGVMKGSCGCE